MGEDQNNEDVTAGGGERLLVRLGDNAAVTMPRALGQTLGLAAGAELFAFVRDGALVLTALHPRYRSHFLGSLFALEDYEKDDVERLKRELPEMAPLADFIVAALYRDYSDTYCAGWLSLGDGPGATQDFARWLSTHGRADAPNDYFMRQEE